MGHKIQTFAKVVMILGIIACIVVSFIGFKQYYNNRPYFQYATVFGGYSPAAIVQQYSPGFGTDWEERGNESLQGFSIMVGGLIGVLSCLFAGLPLYWFGCLFERVEFLQLDVAELKREKNKP